MRPVLVLLAGPNGAGKSTLYQIRVAPGFTALFINADLIQRDELGDASMKAAYEAARIAARRRAELMEARQSFATETVFSHPSKLDTIKDAQARGYVAIVMHVGVADPDLSVARVQARTEEGGHDVPHQKIRDRYVRGQPLIRQAVLGADRGMVFDNSRLNVPPRLMLLFVAGRLLRAEPILPGWVLKAYAQDLTL